MSHGCARIDTNTRNISAYQCNQWAIMSHRPAQMDTDTWNISVDQCNQWENIYSCFRAVPCGSVVNIYPMERVLYKKSH